MLQKTFAGVVMAVTCLLFPTAIVAQTNNQLARTAPADGYISFAEEHHGVVWKVGSIQVQAQGQDNSCPFHDKLGDLYAGTYLYLFNENQRPAGIRVYDSSCYVTQKSYGRTTFYEVSSRVTGTGVGNSMLSLVSPEGIVLNIYDDTWVSASENHATVTQHENGSEAVLFKWKTDCEVVPGVMDSRAHEALVTRNSLRLRHQVRGEYYDVYDWSDLHVITAKYTGVGFAEGMLQLQFETPQGEQLNLLPIDKGWFAWMEKNANIPLQLTVGTCNFAVGAQSGSGTYVYNALPVAGAVSR